MAGRVVVLGATGYAGGLAVDALLARGVRPVLAGTREAVLRELAEAHGGLEWRRADAARWVDVAALVQAGDVLVTTVGPFSRLGRVVARAAAERGAHYVDSTGEVDFVRDLVETLDPIARESGSVMLPAFGYDYVPGLLAGALAMEQAPRATSLRIGYLVQGSLEGRIVSQGTRRTLLEEMGGPTLVRAGGRLQERRYASDITHFDVWGRRRAAVLVDGTEVLFLPRHWPGLGEVSVFNGWFGDRARALQVLSGSVSTLRRVPGFGRVLERVGERFIGPAGGPDASERSRTRAGVVAVTSTPQGGHHQVQLLGPNSYDLTAELMAWAADELAHGHGRIPGVVDAITAFGLPALQQATTAMGLRPVP